MDRLPDRPLCFFISFLSLGYLQASKHSSKLEIPSTFRLVNTFSLSKPSVLLYKPSVNMEISTAEKGSIVGFFREKGFDDTNIHEMLRKCRRLENVARDRACDNWNYLNSVGIQERKLHAVVSKCPKLLALGFNEKLVPMVHCLETLATKPTDVASALTRFPNILSHSIEEKLCPLLAFFQSMGIPEKQLGKLLISDPRLISYSIESKLSPIVDCLADLGFNGEGVIGKILVKNPFIMGYSVEKRLRPTMDFLITVGLKKDDLQRVAVNFPEVLCRDVEKTLRPNLEFLRRSGFRDERIAVLVSGYPPVLIKSIKKSLEPRIRFLVEVMGRGIDEISEYPEFFHHGLKKRLESRYRILKRNNVDCSSLRDMFDCNQKKFLVKFGLS